MAAENGETTAGDTWKEKAVESTRIPKSTYSNVKLVGDRDAGRLCLATKGLIYYPPFAEIGRKVKLSWNSIDSCHASSLHLKVTYKNTKIVRFEFCDDQILMQVMGDMTDRIQRYTDGFKQVDEMNLYPLDAPVVDCGSPIQVDSLLASRTASLSSNASDRGASESLRGSDNGRLLPGKDWGGGAYEDELLLGVLLVDASHSEGIDTGERGCNGRAPSTGVGCGEAAPFSDQLIMDALQQEWVMLQHFEKQSPLKVGRGLPKVNLWFLLALVVAIVILLVALLFVLSPWEAPSATPTATPSSTNIPATILSGEGLTYIPSAVPTSSPASKILVIASVRSRKPTPGPSTDPIITSAPVGRNPRPGPGPASEPTSTIITSSPSDVRVPELNLISVSTRKPKTRVEYGSVSVDVRSLDCHASATKTFALSSAFNYTVADSYAAPNNWKDYEAKIAVQSFRFLKRELERIYPDAFDSLTGEQASSQIIQAHCDACQRYDTLFQLQFSVTLTFSQCVDPREVLHSVPPTLRYKKLLALVNRFLPSSVGESGPEKGSRYPFADVKVLQSHDPCLTACRRR